MNADESNDESNDEHSDATIMRPVTPVTPVTSVTPDAPDAPDAEMDDSTIVRPVAPEPQFDEATMVRPPPAPRGAPDDGIDIGLNSDQGIDEEATVVRVLPASGAAGSEATPPRLSRRDVRKSRDEDPARVDSISSSVALPVEDPEEPEIAERRRWGSRKQQGLDPIRVISPVPGSAPWDPELMPERGVRRETAVIYGPRSEHMGDTRRGADQVHAQLGQAPSARVVEVRPARELLPSVASRSRRSRYTTLIVGGAVVAISIAGLWVIAMIAFS